MRRIFIECNVEAKSPKIVDFGFVKKLYPLICIPLTICVIVNEPQLFDSWAWSKSGQSLNWWQLEWHRWNLKGFNDQFSSDSSMVCAFCATDTPWWHELITEKPDFSGSSSRHSIGSRGVIARLGLATEKADTPSTSEEDRWGWMGAVVWWMGTLKIWTIPLWPPHLHTSLQRSWRLWPRWQPMSPMVLRCRNKWCRQRLCKRWLLDKKIKSYKYTPNSYHYKFIILYT